MTVTIEPLDMSDPRLGGPYDNVENIVVTQVYIMLYRTNETIRLDTDGKPYSVAVSRP